jgi:hypothetical protein
MWYAWGGGWKIKTIFVGKYEGKRILGRLRRRWKDNTTMDHNNETGT